MPRIKDPMRERVVQYMRRYPSMRVDAIATLVASELADEARRKNAADERLAVTSAPPAPADRAWSDYWRMHR